MVKTPTERQQQCVDSICAILGIEFPTSSKEYNSAVYSAFIARWADEAWAKEYEENDIADLDYLLAICINDCWVEEY